MASSGRSTSFRPESTICSVEYTSQIQKQEVISRGQGVICGMEFPIGLWQTLLITTFQVLPIGNRSEITGLKLIFNDKKIENLHPTSDWVKILWSNAEFDFTAVQLSKIAIDVLSREHPLITLSSAAPLEHENVSEFSYENDLLIITKGVIERIDGKNIEYKVESNDLIDTETSSLGSPIFNERFQIVGINCNKLKQTSKEQKQMAISIFAIFAAIQKEINSRVKILKQTDNNKWLEWINKQVRQPVGTGGYAKVFKTLDLYGNVIALKVVEGFGSLKAYQSEAVALEKEFKLVTYLENHSRIVQFFAFVRDNANSRLIIVMEYLEGGSLSDKIKSAGKFDKSTSLRYLIQILEGVDFLHKQSIFHSDIKPANILLTENDFIKICDFGIAVQIRTNSSATASHLKGACFYMSPERINGTSRSAENDMWSVGATFVTMITGNTINNSDTSLFPQMKIANYELFIDGEPLKQFLKKLNENDYYIREIISRTLCTVENRVTAEILLKICIRFDSNDQSELILEYAIYLGSSPHLLIITKLSL